MRRDLRLIVLIREDLPMQLQRQHFLLSYFKTLSVGPAGVELTTSRMTTRCSINWATGARCWAVCGSMVNFSFCMFSALVPRVFPHCVQHFLHISTHFRVRDFRAEHWKRSIAKSASTLQVQSIRRKELAFSLLVSFQLTEIISALTNSHISTHRDLAKNYRLSWTEFFFWIASGKRKKKQFCCIFF